MSNSVRPHRREPTRLPHPWDSPGKNTGVGCHFLLQSMKVKSESEVAQSCPTLSDPMDCSLPGSSIHEIFQARVLEWGAIAFSDYSLWFQKGLNASHLSLDGFFSHKFIIVTVGRLGGGVHMSRLGLTHWTCWARTCPQGLVPQGDAIRML